MTNSSSQKKVKKEKFVPVWFWFTGFFLALFVWFAPGQARAASLSLEPTTGSFTVGSTFDVPIYIDTEDDTINALSVEITFPADLLQLASPSVGGNSVIKVWTAQPSFNNRDGTVNFIGGIPNGLKTSHGLVATLTFRVRGVGTAIIKFSDTSKILRHDGLGTNVLTALQNGLYELTLPPPQGPIVFSETHPLQSKWYKSDNATLSWETVPQSEGYSYILTREPGDIPDDIPEGLKTSVAYNDLSSNSHYFHIKSLRDGVWGGITHFAVKIDKEPPADFEIEIIPSNRTVRRQPIIQFSTTDDVSAVAFYEIKIITLSNSNNTAAAFDTGHEEIFIQATSPYVPEQLDNGRYHVLVRAYDEAGNWREVTESLSIVKQVFELLGSDGIRFGTVLNIPWGIIWLIIIIILIGLGYTAWAVRRWHYRVEQQKVQQELPNRLQQQLAELKAYRKRYGKLGAILLLAAGLWAGSSTQAQEIAPSPPTIEIVSRNITNEDIFYIGGITEVPSSKVFIYMQNSANGETKGFSTVSNEKREWFYQHDSFLPAGTYLLWAQTRLDELASPPSPQIKMSVSATALQFGVSRVSFELLYLILLSLVSLVMISLIVYIIWHSRFARKKNRLVMKEVREAEESVRRGFAVLRRDIEAELETIGKARLSKALSHEEKEREQQLLKDLNSIEKYISREVWEVEQAEQS